MENTIKITLCKRNLKNKLITFITEVGNKSQTILLRMAIKAPKPLEILLV